MIGKKIIQKIVVGALIVQDGKALLLQRHKNESVYPGMWELPSGKREFGETSEEALAREVLEETGLEVKIGQPFFVFDYQLQKDDGIYDVTQINFLVHLRDSSQQVVLSKEHQAFEWITLEELEKFDMSNATKEAIQKRMYQEE